MGFCTQEEYEEFMREAPEFRAHVIRSGLTLTKFWFSVTPAEQRTRFIIRRVDPVRQWKLRPDGHRVTGQVGGVHRGEGGDVLLHRHG